MAPRYRLGSCSMAPRAHHRCGGALAVQRASTPRCRFQPQHEDFRQHGRAPWLLWRFGGGVALAVHIVGSSARYAGCGPRADAGTAAPWARWLGGFLLANTQEAPMHSMRTAVLAMLVALLLPAPAVLAETAPPDRSKTAGPISPELAKKCRALAIKAHPTQPAASALRAGSNPPPCSVYSDHWRGRFRPQPWRRSG